MLSLEKMWGSPVFQDGLMAVAPLEVLAGDATCQVTFLLRFFRDRISGFSLVLPRSAMAVALWFFAAPQRAWRLFCGSAGNQEFQWTQDPAPHGWRCFQKGVSENWLPGHQGNVSLKDVHLCRHCCASCSIVQTACMFRTALRP